MKGVHVNQLVYYSPEPDGRDLTETMFPFLPQEEKAATCARLALRLGAVCFFNNVKGYLCKLKPIEDQPIYCTDAFEYDKHALSELWERCAQICQHEFKKISESANKSQDPDH